MQNLHILPKTAKPIHIDCQKGYNFCKYCHCNPNFIARADAFTILPATNAVLRTIGLLTIVLAGVFAPWWSGLVWLLFLPAIFWFAWTYWSGAAKLFQDLRFMTQNRKRVRELRKLRRKIYRKADRILKR